MKWLLCWKEVVRQMTHTSNQIPNDACSSCPVRGDGNKFLLIPDKPGGWTVPCEWTWEGSLVEHFSNSHFFYYLIKLPHQRNRVHNEHAMQGKWATSSFLQKKSENRAILSLGKSDSSIFSPFQHFVQMNESDIHGSHCGSDSQPAPCHSCVIWSARNPSTLDPLWIWRDTKIAVLR